MESAYAHLRIREDALDSFVGADLTQKAYKVSDGSIVVVEYKAGIRRLVLRGTKE